MAGMPILLKSDPARGTSSTNADPHSLAGIAIFRELAADVLDSLSRRCRWRWYDAGQTILQRQDASRDIFFVVRGRVRAIYHSMAGREIHFGDLAAGEIFGEFGAIDGEPRSSDIVCVTDALIASMSAETFWDVLRRHATVCAAILRRLTQIARAGSRRVVEFSTLPVRSRLHAELLRLARAGEPCPSRNAAIIAPAPTHAELASRISTHREAVTRELNELARAKLIEKAGNTLIIRDVAALANLVEEISGEPCDEVTVVRQTARAVPRQACARGSVGLPTACDRPRL